MPIARRRASCVGSDSRREVHAGFRARGWVLLRWCKEWCSGIGRATRVYVLGMGLGSRQRRERERESCRTDGVFGQSRGPALPAAWLGGPCGWIACT